MKAGDHAQEELPALGETQERGVQKFRILPIILGGLLELFSVLCRNFHWSQSGDHLKEE